MWHIHYQHMAILMIYHVKCYTKYIEVFLNIIDSTLHCHVYYVWHFGVYNVLLLLLLELDDGCDGGRPLVYNVHSHIQCHFSVHTFRGVLVGSICAKAFINQTFFKMAVLFISKSSLQGFLWICICSWCRQKIIQSSITCTTNIIDIFQFSSLVITDFLSSAN